MDYMDSPLNREPLSWGGIVTPLALLFAQYEAPPSPAHWRRVCDPLLLWLGMLTMMAGSLFFVAANWQALGRFSRLAVIETPLLLMALLLWRKPKQESIRQLLFVAVSLNIGALLALIGQIYQLGADPWQLFVIWALLLLPLAILGQRSPLWIVSWILGQVALLLYWHALSLNSLVAFNSQGAAWSITLFNTLVWVSLFFVSRFILFPRWLVMMAIGVGTTLLVLLALFDEAHVGAWPCWFMWLGIAYLTWRQHLIAGLAMVLLMVIIVLLAATSQWLALTGTHLLLLSVLVIVLSIVGYGWLQRESLRFKEAARLTALPSHWSAQLFLGVAGWIAALLFIVSLFLIFTYDTRFDLLLSGVLFAGAYLIYRYRRGVFWQQWMLVLLLAANAWFIYALMVRIEGDTPWLWFGLALQALVVIWLFNYGVIRLLYSAGALVLVTIGLASVDLQLLAMPLAMMGILFCYWQGRLQPVAHMSYHVMMIGLSLSLLLLGPLYYPSAGMLVFTSPLSSSLPLWLIVSICASLLLLMIITLKVPIEYGSILILFALLFPGGSVTLLLLLIGLYEKQRSLIRLFGVLLLGYLSLYYYALAPSLLLKSWQLMADGMLLLIGRQYFIFLDTKRNRCEN